MTRVSRCKGSSNGMDIN